MKGSSNNIQFNYLHRDEGNYKIYGSIIFSNKQNLSLDEIEFSIREKLIDEQFFYPKVWGIKLLDNSHLYDFFMEWYEFEGINFTNEEENEMHDISELLSRVKMLKNAIF